MAQVATCQVVAVAVAFLPRPLQSPVPPSTKSSLALGAVATQVIPQALTAATLASDQSLRMAAAVVVEITAFLLLAAVVAVDRLVDLILQLVPVPLEHPAKAMRVVTALAIPVVLAAVVVLEEQVLTARPARVAVVTAASAQLRPLLAHPPITAVAVAAQETHGCLVARAQAAKAAAEMARSAQEAQAVTAPQILVAAAVAAVSSVEMAAMAVLALL